MYQEYLDYKVLLTFPLLFCQVFCKYSQIHYYYFQISLRILFSVSFRTSWVGALRKQTTIVTIRDKKVFMSQHVTALVIDQLASKSVAKK